MRDDRRTLSPVPASAVKVCLARTAVEHWPCRAGGARFLPQSPKVACNLVTCSRPVVADIIAQLDDVAFEVNFVLLQPGDIEFLSRGAALELAGYVFLIIADNSRKSKPMKASL